VEQSIFQVSPGIFAICGEHDPWTYLSDVNRWDDSSCADANTRDEATGIHCGEAAIRKGLSKDTSDVDDGENKHRVLPTP
jgi:hypothetical protein